MDSRHRFSKRWHVANIKNITGNEQATLIVDRNSADIVYTFRFYVCLCLRDRDCCTTADGNDSCHELAPSFFESMIRCRRQKHRRRWPGNPNGRWKFRKYLIYLPILRLFTSTRSRLVLCGWRQRQLLRICTVVFWRDETYVSVVNNIAGNDQDWSKFRNDQNLCLQDQARPLEKHLFAAAIMMPLCTVFFPTVTRNCFCSHLRKIISRWPWPPPKNRDTYWRVSCTFYL